MVRLTRRAVCKALRGTDLYWFVLTLHLVKDSVPKEKTENYILMSLQNTSWIIPHMYNCIYYI